MQFGAGKTILPPMHYKKSKTHFNDIFQNTFDSVGSNIFVTKLENCIRGISNKLFASYFNNRKQFVPINGFKSDVAGIRYLVFDVLYWVLDILHFAIKYLKYITLLMIVA